MKWGGKREDRMVGSQGIAESPLTAAQATRRQAAAGTVCKNEFAAS
jgi:hypothetical protein